MSNELGFKLHVVEWDKDKGVYVEQKSGINDLPVKVKEHIRKAVKAKGFKGNLVLAVFYNHVETGADYYRHAITDLKFFVDNKRVGFMRYDYAYDDDREVWHNFEVKEPLVL